MEIKMKDNKMMKNRTMSCLNYSFCNIRIIREKKSRKCATRFLCLALATREREMSRKSKIKKILVKGLATELTFLYVQSVWGSKGKNV